MEMRILGARNLDFKSNDGSEVKGIQLFVAFKTDNVTGEIADKLFVRNGITLPQFKIGDTLDIAFNNKGKVESIQAIGK